ncbi:MAG: hypothetical protein BEN19_05740 [Epulopiscium sp. Nuni2H_MBin003]|nr:MAG: hypothetical protein BEN19_05740 [Epulopiscium sp. Nuni2H_MBin003]
MRMNDIEVLFGTKKFNKVTKLSVLPPFYAEVCDFLDKLSNILMKNNGQYPDIITFAFFCRKSNINKLKNQYDVTNRLGVGLAFHIAPSNVAINFAYSLVSALLAGNASIIKVSSKEFEQTDLIIKALMQIKNHKIASYITIIKYDSNNIEVTKYLSEICDARIIWGGDETIKKIRQHKLAPRAFDITFANRYSIAIFEANAVLNDVDKICNNFYNDTYLYNQTACTSPQLIYWLGTENQIILAKQKFWETFHKYVAYRYKLEDVMVIDKYINTCKSAIELENILVEPQTDNYIVRVRLDKLDTQDIQFAGGGFFEYTSNNLDDLSEFITKKCQTIGYVGTIENDILSMVQSNGLKGIDRIVPIGKTMDFALVWDGIDLILQMSRKISVI